MKKSIYYFLKYIKHKFFYKYNHPDEEGLSFFSFMVKPGDLVFDIGANQGDMTEIYLKLGAKQVISVEPQKTFAGILRKRFKDHSNVQIVNKALSSEVGVSEILICDSAPTISTMSKDWASKGRFTTGYEWNRKEEIETTTLDQLIKTYGVPQFCKIDVEGFEYEVISGLSQKIPLLSIEYVSEFFDKTIACIDHLKAIGPIMLSTKNEKKNLKVDDFYKPDELLAKLNTADDKLLNGDIYIKFL